MPVALAVMIGKSPLCDKSRIGGVMCFKKGFSVLFVKGLRALPFISLDEELWGGCNDIVHQQHAQGIS